MGTGPKGPIPLYSRTAVFYCVLQEVFSNKEIKKVQTDKIYGGRLLL